MRCHLSCHLSCSQSLITTEKLIPTFDVDMATVYCTIAGWMTHRFAHAEPEGFRQLRVRIGAAIQ
jgi:hypothetical protein